MNATVIPTLQYHDAPTAIDWLCRAFGFKAHVVYPDDAGGKFVAPPGPNGVNTQSAFVIVDDADEYHARALAAGAQIVYPLEDKPYGGRGYGVRDPEGHVWSFGTYSPWAQALR